MHKGFIYNRGNREIISGYEILEDEKLQKEVYPKVCLKHPCLNHFVLDRSKMIKKNPCCVYENYMHLLDSSKALVDIALSDPRANIQESINTFNHLSENAVDTFDIYTGLKFKLWRGLIDNVKSSYASVHNPAEVLRMDGYVNDLIPAIFSDRHDFQDLIDSELHLNELAIQMVASLSRFLSLTPYPKKSFHYLLEHTPTLDAINDLSDEVKKYRKNELDKMYI